MSNLITRRELPLMLAAPFMLQKLALAAQAAGAQGALPTPDPKVMKIWTPKDMEIDDKGKTTGSTTVTLYGDQSVEGSLYGLHYKWYPHSNSRPHYHVHDRYIYVLKGTWWLGWGTDFDMDKTYPATAGTFVHHIANQIHYDGAKDEPCELYMVGIGPAASIPAGQQPGEQNRGGRGRAQD